MFHIDVVFLPKHWFAFMLFPDAAKKVCKETKSDNLCLEKRQQACIEECALEAINIFKFHETD